MRVERLASAEHFRQAYREGKRFSDGLLVIYVRRNGLPVCRVGIAVAKRVGTAVKRNRTRRRVREACRRWSGNRPAGVDIVIVPGTSAATAPVADLEASVGTLLAQAGLTRPV